MDNDVCVSKHAYERMRERLGINKKAAQRMAVRAYEAGIGYSDTSGRLQKYIEKNSIAYMRQGTRIIIYGDAVYCFVCGSTSKYDKTLVTVLHLPNELKNQAHGVRRKMKQRVSDSI